MLTVTVGITILKDLLNSSLYGATNEQRELWNRISQHKIALSLELQDQYRMYCEKKLDFTYLDQMENFLAHISTSQDMSVWVTCHNKTPRIENDEYLNALLSVCINTDDRILLESKSKMNKNIIEKKHIQLLEKSDIMDIDTSRNIFTMYTFPVVNHRISQNEDSKALGRWIGRILKDQGEFCIYDNYIGTSNNIKNFRKYILKYIPPKSTISIITIESNTVRKADLIKEFADEFYKQWNIEVLLAKDKKESHARVIVMPQYTVFLDKGIQTFGSEGKTESSMITIKYTCIGKHYALKTSEKIYP